MKIPSSSYLKYSISAGDKTVYLEHFDQTSIEWFVLITLSYTSVQAATVWPDVSHIQRHTNMHTQIQVIHASIYTHAT